MNVRNTTILGVLGLAAIMSIGGCETQQRQTTKSTAQTESQPATVTSRGWPSRSSSSTSMWTSQAFPTGDARTSAVGIEKGVPTEVRVNEEFKYQIIVTNLTDDALESVMVHDVPGEGLELKSSDPQGSMKGGEATWNLGDMGPRQSRTINVSAVATSEGRVGSCADVSYASTLCMSVPVVSPKLLLTKRGPAEVLKCENITYTFEVKNTGTGTIDNVAINDPLPDGLRTADGKGAVSFNVGSLTAGQAKQYTAVVKADKTGRFTNKASASGGGLTTSSGEVATVVRAPKLTIEKSCPESSFVGRPLSYKLTVKNTGDGEARDTMVEDRLPAGATKVLASDRGQFADGRVRWSLGTLKPGDSRTLTVEMTPASAGKLTNTAVASAFCADQVTSSCMTDVTGIPAILLEVVDLEDPVAVGGNTTYVITVTNQGSAPGTNIKLVCTLENNQEYVSASGATNGSGRGQTVTFDALGSLAPQQKATFRVTVKNVKAGDVRFRTSMTSDQLTREVVETEATNVYE